MHTLFNLQTKKIIAVVLLTNLLLLLCKDVATRSYLTEQLDTVGEIFKNKEALAAYQFAPTGGSVILGTPTTTNANHAGIWQGAVGSDANYYTAARTTGGISMTLEFDGVELFGGNKLLVSIEDTNQRTATAYTHQICDWISSDSVDEAASDTCTGGGWRNLHPQDTAYTTNNVDTLRMYEVYDGYFSTRTSGAGTVISTPLTNFIDSTNNRVLIRATSTVTGTEELRIDYARVESAIDPVYEPSGFATTTASSTHTNFISEIIGGRSATDLSGSDDTRFRISMATTSQAIDAYFTFDNVKTLTSMNTILVSPEFCASNVALVFNIYLYNFNTDEWTRGGATSTPSACNTDTTFGFSFNDTFVPGFVFNDHIENGEIRVRFRTNAPAATYNMQFDSLYLMLGSVNTDTSLCDITIGTGTETDCDRTRSMGESIVGTPTTTTWQVTSDLEYPASFNMLDNDDDTVLTERARAMNISFPVVLATTTAVTGIHYAVKYRSATSTITQDVQIRKYGGFSNAHGEAAGSGWFATPGTDTNNSATYGYFDTWRLAEIELSPDDFIDTVNNVTNMRLRSSAATNLVANDVAGDWDFAMMAVRWVEDPKRVNVSSQFAPTGGSVILGTPTTTNANHAGIWQGAVGSDANYYTAARTTGGISMTLEFDGVELFGGNKLLVSIEDTNQRTATAYTHQICDWISSDSVDEAASDTCTGGGWRNLHPQDTAYTTNNVDTLRMYEVYDGYFSTRTSGAGTVISTPLTNFIDSTNNRVLIRATSTVTGTEELRIDYARVESAIDPVYEPSGFATTTASSTHTNFISEIIGGRSATDLSGSDDTRFRISMATTSQAIDAYFTFDNVKTLTSMNTILVSPEFCASNVALVFNIYLYNFNTDEWTRGGATSTPSACNTDTTFGFSFNDTFVPGFVFNDHIENGEIRVRFRTNAPAATYNMQFDSLYLMLGSVNTDTSLCDITIGTGTETDCDRTRSMGESIVGTPTTTTWQVTSDLEYPASFNMLDNDDDTVLTERARAMNISFPMVLATTTAVTGIHYAVKYRSATSTITQDVQIRKYGGFSNAHGEAAGSGWFATPGTDTNNSATYGYFDTWRLAEIELSPDDFIDTVNNVTNMRLRSSAATNLVANDVAGDWDFAMMAVRWVEKYPPQYITFSLSDNSIGFGPLAGSGARYATGDLLGSDTDTTAHTLRVATNANDGYSILINGTSLTCSSCDTTIAPIGDIATTSLIGTEQFGVRIGRVSGTGTTTDPYNTELFAFATTSFPDQIASGDGDEYVTTYDTHYLANISSDTDAGTYTAVITYTVTGMY